jgi:hypothetical protein
MDTQDTVSFGDPTDSDGPNLDDVITPQYNDLLEAV